MMHEHIGRSRPTANVTNVADDARLAGPEAIKDALPVDTIDEAVDMFSLDFSLEEPLLNMLGVGAIDAVTERRPVLATRRRMSR